MRSEVDDNQKKFSWCLEGAKEGNASLQCIVAMRYLSGKGVENDAKAAAQWIALSTKQNYSYAYVVMGEMYEKGEGFEKKEKTAFECYVKGAKLRDGYAYVELARCYRWGIGTKRDKEMSDQWVIQAFANKKLCDDFKQNHVALKKYISQKIGGDLPEIKYKQVKHSSKGKKARILAGYLIASGVCGILADDILAGLILIVSGIVIFAIAGIFG